MRFSKSLYFASIFIIFFTLFAYFFHPIDMIVANTDIGRHIILGKIIVNSSHVPSINLLSYTYSNFPFINTHWLSQVIYFLFYKYLTISSLIFLSIFTITIAFFIIFIICVKKFNPIATSLLALLYLQLLSQRTEVRPEIFSFMLLSVFLTILYKNREKYTKLLFLLIPLELVWVNIHIYFFIGIGLLILFIFEALLRKESLKSKNFSRLIVVTISALFTTLINPNFLQGASYPLFVLNNYGFQVAENINYLLAMSTPHDPTLIYFSILVFILWMSIFLARKKLALIDIFISLAFTLLGFFAIRNIPLFVFGTLYPCSKAVSIILSSKITQHKYKNYISSSAFVIVLLLLLQTIQTNVHVNGFGIGIVDNANNAVDFLLTNNIKGPIYNNFDVGNYLEYRLYPKEKVFVDSRPEAYPKDFFQRTYTPMQASPELFKQISTKYNFNVIFLEYTNITYGVTTKLLHDLVRNSDWKIVYLNNEIVIFIKNTPANQTIIKSYEINENNIRLNNVDLTDKQKVQQLANFFKYVDWTVPRLKINLHYLDLDPSNCIALQTVAYIYQEEQQMDASQIYAHRYINASCDSSQLE